MLTAAVSAKVREKALAKEEAIVAGEARLKM